MWIDIPFVPISLTHSFSHQSLKPMASENLQNKLWISILENRQLNELSGSNKRTQLHGTKKVGAMCLFLPECLVIASFFSFSTD